MPSKTSRSPYQYVRYVRFIIFVAKKATRKYKKGQRVSAEYAKRYPKLVKKQQWMRLDNRKLKWDPVTRKQTVGDWETVATDKLTMQEIILRLTKVTDRYVWAALGRYYVFHKLWRNERGNIRITISGMYDGRRIREIVHLGFLRSEWEKLHNGYKQFKEWLVGSILSNLRRRGLRLSNPKESRERLQRLQTRLQTYTANLEHVPSWDRYNQLQKIEAVARDIQAQRKSRQVRGVTIRIEKLI